MSTPSHNLQDSNDLRAYAGWLDIGEEEFSLFESEAKRLSLTLEMRHALTAYENQWVVVKRVPSQIVGALLALCDRRNRKPLRPEAKTFEAWKHDTEARGAQKDAEKRLREDDLKWARVFIKRGKDECKRICAEFMQIAREFLRARNINIGGQLALELSARTFDNVCQRIEQGYGTALAQDAAYMECWARGTWRFPKLGADIDTSRPAPLSPQMIEYEKMERRLEERDGPLADEFCKREDRMTRVLAALEDPKGPCGHLHKQLGEWAAQGELNWRAATMLCGKDEVTMRPAARAFLAVLEHQARGEQYDRPTGKWYLPAPALAEGAR